MPNFWLHHHGPNCRRCQPQKQSTLLAAVKKTVFVLYPFFSGDDRLSGSLVFIPSIGFAHRWTDDLASQEDGQDSGGGVRIVHVRRLVQ